MIIEDFKKAYNSPKELELIRVKYKVKTITPLLDQSGIVSEINLSQYFSSLYKEESTPPKDSDQNENKIKIKEIENKLEIDDSDLKGDFDEENSINSVRPTHRVNIRKKNDHFKDIGMIAGFFNYMFGSSTKAATKQEVPLRESTHPGLARLKNRETERALLIERIKAI